MFNPLKSSNISACPIEVGVYIFAGNDVARGEKPTHQECARWCAAEKDCIAWTFNSDRYYCWLKSNDDEKGCPDGDCSHSPWVTGTKNCAGTIPY